MRFLVSNDDGYLSPGLYLLAESVRELGEVVIASTEVPRSATGREITFNRPLRLARKKWFGWHVYVTDGTPIDSVHLVIEVLGFKPDLVLSGINVGDNLSLQHIFYSGTVAIAIEAALMKIPAIAFSSDVESFEDFENEEFRKLSNHVVRGVTEYVLNKGLPQGVDILSVNIPVRFKGCVDVVKATKVRWEASYRKSVDPRGREYYWLAGIRSVAEPGSDVSRFEEGCVTVTPLKIDLNSDASVLKDLHALEEVLSTRVDWQRV
ncbi:MAG: 5'/3'-nucleotidase SurE [Zestosphaera sp.]